MTMQGSSHRQNYEAPSILRYLKDAKNKLVGHPNAKINFYREGCIPIVVGYINQDTMDRDCSDVRTEAAHVIAALAYGPKEVLHGILSSSALEALLSAISRLGPTESTSLRLGLVKALRSLGSALAEAVGPSLWGLEEDACDIRHEAGAALDQLFQDAALDIYLPILAESDLQLETAVCQLISSCTRLPKYRTSIVSWLPPDERVKQNKGKRGWEDPIFASTDSPNRQGGWVIRHLTGILQYKDVKAQVSSLMAIAALVKDNANTASILVRTSFDGKASSVLSLSLSLMKARNVEVRLAACQCVTNIIKREQTGRGIQYSLESNNILHVLSRVIGDQLESAENRTRACFILSNLVADDVQCSENALSSGTVALVAELIKTITPTERPQEWDDGEPNSVLRLRESALIAVAALTLHRNDARDKITSMYGLMPHISVCLSHPHIGVRHAACQCVRSLSRAVSVLRTSILDSGVGEILCKIIEDVHEDRRVASAALAGLCNLLNDFSPLRKTILENGVMRRMAALSICPDHSLRLNAVWAIRNSLYKAPIDEGRSIMAQVGWDKLRILTRDAHDDVKEQAFAAMCNFASTEQGVKDIFNAFHIPGEGFLDILTEAVTSSNDDILCQVMYILGNIANGGYQDRLVSHRGIISLLHTGIENPKQDICRAALKCIDTLADGRYRELRDEGIDATLKRIARDGASSSGGHREANLDAEIKRFAKHALHTLDSPMDDDRDMSSYSR